MRSRAQSVSNATTIVSAVAVAAGVLWVAIDLLQRQASALWVIWLALPIAAYAFTKSRYASQLEFRMIRMIYGLAMGYAVSMSIFYLVEGPEAFRVLASFGHHANGEWDSFLIAMRWLLLVPAVVVPCATWIVLNPLLGKREESEGERLHAEWFELCYWPSAMGSQERSEMDSSVRKWELAGLRGEYSKEEAARRLAMELVAIQD
jgi:hypothetical protein